AVLVLLYDPRYIPTVQFNGTLQVSVHGRHNDEVRPVDLTDQAVGPHRIFPVVQTCIWMKANEFHGEYRLAGLAGEEIIHTTEQLAWTFNVSQKGAFRHEDRNVFHMLDFVLSKCICLKANSIGDVPRPKVTNPDVAINPSNCRIYPSRMVKILW